METPESGYFKLNFDGGKMGKLGRGWRLWCSHAMGTSFWLEWIREIDLRILRLKKPKHVYLGLNALKTLAWIVWWLRGTGSY